MKYAVHPAAECFPLIDGIDYAEFKGSIQGIGQLEPIKVDHATNLLLDGRNRLRACEELGIEPRVEFITTSDAYGYVIGLNLLRRHMDDMQRKAIAARLSSLEKGSNQYQKKVEVPNGTSTPVISQAQAGAALGLTKRQVASGKRTMRQDPELHEAAFNAGKAGVDAVKAKRAAMAAELTTALDKLEATQQRIRDQRQDNRRADREDPIWRSQKFSSSLATSLKEIHMRLGHLDLPAILEKCRVIGDIPFIKSRDLDYIETQVKGITDSLLIVTSFIEETRNVIAHQGHGPAVYCQGSTLTH